MYRRKRELPNLDKMAEVGITRKYWRYARCSVIAGLCAAILVGLASGGYLAGYTKGMSFESFSLARKSRPPLPVSVQPLYRSTTSNDSTNPRTVGKSEVPAKLEPGSFSPITVSLVSPQKDSIKVGDMIHYRIVCRDKSGDLPSSGGGYWAAIFDSKSNHKASTAGRVVDHKNGTYSIYVYAGWAGQGTLSVVRVLSPEAEDFMNNTMWPAADRAVWWGTFEPPKGDRESKLCWLKRGGNFTDMCVYPNPKAIGKTVFACLKPTRVDCKYLTMTKSDSRRMNGRMGQITRQKAGLVNKAKSHLRDEIKIVDPTVTISGPPIAADPALPKCLPGQNRPLGDGYWLEGKWKTLLCEYTDWSEQSKLLSCMKNRQFYYFGDSTTRQWFLSTLEMIGRKFQMRFGIDLGWFWERYYEDIDMRIVLSFPKQLLGSRLVKLNETNYEVDLIEGFNDTRCNYVIMVSPWAHFTNWAKESYIERTWLLRESLIRFRRRCPKAKIILKGPHAKQATRSTINSADYINKGIEEVNRKALEDIGVWFLPTWDLNLAHPIRNTIHMPPPLIVAELKVFFSYVCGDSEIPPLNV